MLRQIPRRLQLGTLLLALSLAGCGDDDDDAATVTVRFDHVVAGAPLEFDTVEYQNATGNVYSLSLLEYIVSDIDLVRTDGRHASLGDIHYRDARRSETGSFTALKVPAGDYVALRFTFGVAPGQQAPNTEDFNNMRWPDAMGGGWHYMRLEGRYDDGGESRALLSHTGPSGGADFTFSVELPLALHLDGDDVEIHVVMDVNEWFEDPILYDLSAQGMIMGNADAQHTHQANGATVFRLGDVGASHDHDE